MPVPSVNVLSTQIWKKYYIGYFFLSLPVNIIREPLNSRTFN